MKTIIKFKIDYKTSFGAFYAGDQVTIDKNVVSSAVAAEVDALIKYGVVSDVGLGVDNELKTGVHRFELSVDDSKSTQNVK